jgi:hypothetical protein
MNIDNLSLKAVSDVLGSLGRNRRTKNPYLKGADREHARNCSINFAWLRDQIRKQFRGSA